MPSLSEVRDPGKVGRGWLKLLPTQSFWRDEGRTAGRGWEKSSPSIRVTREEGKTGRGLLKFERMISSANDVGRAGSSGWLVIFLKCGFLISSLTRDEGRAGKGILL